MSCKCLGSMRVLDTSGKRCLNCGQWIKEEIKDGKKN